MNGDAVQVLVTNRQTVDGQTDTLETRANGRLFFREDGFKLLYTEVSADGDKTAVSVTAKGETVAVQRSGAVSNRLFFEQGTRTTTAYRTPYGDLPMGVRTENIELSCQGKSGSLKLCYALDFNGQAASENQLLLTFASE